MTESNTELNTRAPQVPEKESNYEVQEPLGVPVDRGAEVVATTLAPQLGSDTHHLGRGNFDMRKLSVIEQKDIPFLIYAAIRSKKTSVWGTIRDEYLNLQVSVNGRGRKDIIRMEGVSKGGLPDQQPDLEKPGWISRNFLDREWKKRAQDEML